MLNLSVVNKFSHFVDMEDEWESLRTNNGYSIFSSFDWYWCCLKALDNPNASLFIIVIREERSGIIKGILPLRKGVKKFGLLKLKGLESLRNEDSPLFELVLDRAIENELIRITLEFLNDRKDIQYLELFPASQHFIPIFKEHAKYLFSDIGKRSPYLETSYFESVVKSKSRKFRQTNNNIVNRVNRSSGVSVQEITKNTDGVLDTVYYISSHSWKHHSGDSLTNNDYSRTFFRYLTTIAEKNRWLKIWILKVNNQAIAMEYHLCDNETEYALRSDFIEGFEKLSPGSYLNHYIINSLCENPQMNVYDMCGDNYSYKTRWTDSVNVYNRMLFIKNPVLGLLYSLKRRFNTLSVSLFKGKSET